MTNYEYDRLVGKDNDYNYCDCGKRLVTSMESNSGICSDCRDKERLNEEE